MVFKIIRRLIQWSFFTLFIISFLSFLPVEAGVLTSYLPRIQFYPSLLRLSPIVLIILLVTLIFGRFYCSTICPMATIQDIMIKIRKRYSFRKLNLFQRYLIPLLSIVLLFVGYPSLAGLIDPYSASGRIISSFDEVVVIPIINGTAQILRNFSIYITSYPSEIRWITIIFSIVSLIILMIFTLVGGRLFCNTLCPVGAILSIPAKWSFFAHRINKDRCTSCGACEKSCKAEAIDAKGKYIDSSRCISCFNCMDTCHFDALKYGKKNSSKKSNGRREFLKNTALSSIVMASLPATVRAKESISGTFNSNATAIPPGSVSIDRYLSKCTSCSLCITRCPGKVLKPSGFSQFGLTGVGVPHMDFNSGACDYECKLCSELCPTSAIKPHTLSEKKVVKIGEAQFIRRFCVVETDRTSCGACGEICPTGAIDMLHVGDSSDGELEIPVIDKKLCIGCGACQLVCPVTEKNAIFVKGADTHSKAKVRKIEKESGNDEEIDNSFAF